MERAKVTRTLDNHYQVVWPDGRAWYLFASLVGATVAPNRDFRHPGGVEVTTLHEDVAVALCERFHRDAEPEDLENWIREMSGFTLRSPSPSDLADSIALHAGPPVAWVEGDSGVRSDHWLWTRGDHEIELILDDEGGVSLTADGIGYLPELAAADLLGRLLSKEGTQC